MIEANLQAMLAAAKRLDELSESLVAATAKLETALKTENERVSVFFWRRSARRRDSERLLALYRESAAGMRAQSLYFRECAKRYKSAQSRAVIRAEAVK